jgi:type IV pilus assembly protein PilB
MVFSTLHTNDAPSTVTRLRDMGVPPFLITATMEAVLAQRLVRKICQNCREPEMPDVEQLAELELKPEDVVGKTFYRGRGCAACNNTGFKGRTGLFEYMPMNDEIRDLINTGASTEAIRHGALRAGMRSLRVSGLDKVFTGVTTIEEAIRETVHDV